MAGRAVLVGPDGQFQRKLVSLLTHRTVIRLAAAQARLFDGGAAAGTRLTRSLEDGTVAALSATSPPQVLQRATARDALTQHLLHRCGQPLCLLVGERFGWRVWIDAGAPQALVGVAVAHARHDVLIQQSRLHGDSLPGEANLQRLRIEARVEHFWS